MAIEVTRESDELIRKDGAPVRSLEFCQVCKPPTQYWTDDGKCPLCQIRTDTKER